MSHPLLYRGRHIVVTMDDSQRLRYHVGNPFTPGYTSREEAYDAIDSQLDN